MDKIEEIIHVGRWIWEKDLTAGLSGNISVKISPQAMLITAHASCLGMLREEDIGEMDLAGHAVKKDFHPSTEKPLHAAVYKHLEAKAVVHCHPAFSSGYFSVHDRIAFDTFETRLVLGEIPVVAQKTPAVTDVTCVVEALKKNNVVVLKNHGVVAVGETLQDAFFLIQTLEEAVKMAVIRDFYGAQKKESPVLKEAAAAAASASKKYPLFSEQQIQEIVRCINEDEKFKELALETALQTNLAVVLEETGKTFCFHFSDGKITKYTTTAEEAEFVISGKADYWRAIFNRQLDPFAATTQKKLKLKGDFAKISRWYVPFNRLFELWLNVPVE